MSGGSSFRSRVGERISSQVIQASFSVSPGLKVMVVDQLSMRVISSVLRMFDLMEEGVTLVELITNSRQPLRSLEALYFLSPTADSVARLVADYGDAPPPPGPSAPDGGGEGGDSPAPKKRRKRLYGDAHVFFIGHLGESEFALLQSAPSLLKRIKTLKEIPLEFLVPEASLFSLDMGAQGLLSAFSPQESSSRALRAYAATLGRKLLGVVSALGGPRPLIRYAGGSPLARMVAQALNDEAYAEKASPLFASGAGGGSGPRTSTSSGRRGRRGRRGGEENAGGGGGGKPVVLIVDRSVDVLAPLMHELTYQAMAMDLLPIDEGKYVYVYQDGTGKSHEKTVLLDDSDDLWVSLRHMHIKDAIEWVQSQFSDFLRSNRAAQARGQRVDTLRGMSEAIRALPQYQELLAKFSLHIQICQDNLAVYNERTLERIIDLEQNMAMGETAEGERVTEVMSTLLPILQDPSVSVHDKKRLLLIYFITQEGLRPAERSKLLEKARLSPADQQMISNLALLQVQVQALPGSRQKKKKKKKQKHRADADEDVDYELSRFVPPLKSVMRDLATNSLDHDAFPALPTPDGDAAGSSGGGGTGASEASSGRAGGRSVRTRQSKWASKRKGGRGGDNGDGAGPSGSSAQGEGDHGGADGDTYVVFVIGGMSYSEARAAYEVASSYRTANLVLGSTSLVTPMEFMDQLADLDPYVDDVGASGAGGGSYV